MTQAALNICDARHRPVIGLNGAMAMLDKHEDEVLALIEGGDTETGGLSHAWDISSQVAQRREVRVLTESIRELKVAWAQGWKLRSHGDRFRMRNAGDDLVWGLICPPGHKQPFLKTPQIQRCLNCSADLVIDLIKEGQFELLNGSGYGRGRYGAALVTVESVREFLRKRRLP